METKTINVCRSCGGELSASVCGDCTIAAFGASEARRKVNRSRWRELYHGKRKRSRALRQSERGIA